MHPILMTQFAQARTQQLRSTAVARRRELQTPRRPSRRFALLRTRHARAVAHA